MKNQMATKPLGLKIKRVKALVPEPNLFDVPTAQYVPITYC